MKIIRLTTSLDFGGQEKQYISFTNHPQLLQNTYYFGCLGRGGFTEEDLKKKGFKVRVFGNNPSITNIWNIWSLFRWFKRIKPDIVHTAVGEANFHGVLAAKLAGIKVVIAEEVGIPSHSKSAIVVFKMIYSLASKVICVSNSVKNHLVDIGEIRPIQGHVVYNPVFFPLKFNRIKQASFTIVCVGRLEKVKNQQLLINALPKIEDQEVNLILVGDGSEKSNLEILIENLLLKDRVQIIGFVENPFEWLEKADLFVLPSFSEGFGIAAVEAMQLGIPCLCSNVGGIPEFIQDEQTGWLFDPHEEADLIAKLDLILRLDEDARLKVGARGKEAVLDRFSENKYITYLETYYKRLASDD